MPAHSARRRLGAGLIIVAVGIVLAVAALSPRSVERLTDGGWLAGWVGGLAVLGLLSWREPGARRQVAMVGAGGIGGIVGSALLRMLVGAIWPDLVVPDPAVAGAIAVAAGCFFAGLLLSARDRRVADVRPVRRGTLVVGAIALSAALGGLIVGGGLGVVLVAGAAILLLGWVAASIGWAAADRPAS